MAKDSFETKGKKEGGILGFIEKVGNKLPHPIYLFVVLSIVTIIVSAMASNITFIHPGTGETQLINNLASRDGFIWIMNNMIKNFTNFAPLGMVLVMMIGLGLAEETGLLRAVLRKVIVGAPKYLVTFIIVFAGIFGNIAGSATFVIIPPLGGLIFKALKRNPIAGVAAGFAGVSAGLSANLLITPTDVLLSGIVQEAARIIDPEFIVHPAVNWYFMMVSTILLSIVGTLVTEKIVEPRLGVYNPADGEEDSDEDLALMEISDLEKKGLRNALISTLLYFVLIAAMVVPKTGILRDEKLGTIVPSPFLSNMTIIIFFWFLIVALVYGISSKTIKKSNDVIDYMTESMKGFAGFIVLCFFAAQFVAFFGYSNLGLLLSVKGSEVLEASGFVGIPLLITFILFVGFVNIFIGSASAKLALLAPIFVPMFMQIGFSPFLTEAAYRITDSVVNSISPLEPFMPFIIVLSQRYNKKSGLGSVISMMTPYAVSFLVAWSILLVIFYAFNIPLGPGALPIM